MNTAGEPWRGRRMHLVGVGGAGMSAYARAARALGATLTGSDAHESPYLQALRADGVLDASVGHTPENLPQGDDVELYYSSAVPAENPERAEARERGIPEWPRAKLLGELSAMRRTIAVAGTHGKTTTAAMVVHALRGAGVDPGWLIGATIGDGLANGHWSEGEWLVVEADESDRSLLALKVELALLTNVELDHHTSFGSLQELRELFRGFLAHAPTAVIWDRPELLELRAGPVVAYDVDELTLLPGGSRFRWREHEVRLTVPGVHNALNATGALELVRLAGAGEDGAIAALAAFPGAARRFQRLGESAGGAVVYDDYAHHPSEVAATLQGASTLAHRRLIAVFQPHLYSRTRALAVELGRALAVADVVAVLDVYPARECAEDFPGVSGLLVAEATADAAGGRPVYWLADIDAAERVLAGVLGDGDVCVVMGAGDVDGLARRLVGAVSEEAPRMLRRDQPLAPMTTIGTGGPARYFARVGSRGELPELLAWAQQQREPVFVLGSGSNLLVADEGVPGLVIKLDRELAAISIETPHLLCGGGARLPSVAARSAREGLSGIEFGVNIPGTVGGAVRMNANAYGGELARVLEWVEIAGPDGYQRRRPQELGFAYRSSALREGEVVAGASLLLHPAAVEEVKGTLQEMRRRRHEAQPQGIRTFGSTFKNPEDPGAAGRTAGMLLEQAGCGGLAIGGARFAPKHANFIENTGSARTADVVALMTEGRRRVLESSGVELEPEVHTLGGVRFPWRR